MNPEPGVFTPKWPMYLGVWLALTVSFFLPLENASGYGESMSARVEGTSIIVTLPAAADEFSSPPFCSVASVVSAIQSVASSLVTVSGDTGSSAAVSSCSLQLGLGGTAVPATTVGEVMAAYGGGGSGSDLQALVELSSSDYDQVLQVGTWQLGEGVEGEVHTSTAEVAALLAGNTTLVTVSGSGDGETKAVPGWVALSGGGANCQSISTVAEVVELLNNTPAVTALMSVSGSGETVVNARAYQALAGGVSREPVSTAGEVATVINADSAVSARLGAQVTGSGTAVLQPTATAVELSGGEDIQSVSQVSEVVALLGSTPEVTALMSVSGSGEAVVNPVSQALSGGGVEYAVTDTTAYAWDVPGRLASVTLPTGQVHSYRYDYRTRRIGTQQTAHGEQAAKHTAVLFAGGLSLTEYESPNMQATITNPASSTVRYVRGPDMGGGVGGLLYSRRGGVAKYNLSNGRGDIVAQSDSSATLTWTASYEAYGKRTKETGSNQDKQRANSKEEDPTGLLNEGFRYRDIETGSWLSRDPAGFVDGPNLYAYVKQNPWTSFDPLGLTGLGVNPILIVGADPNGALTQAGKVLTKRIGGFAAGSDPRSQIQYQIYINPQTSEQQVQEYGYRYYAPELRRWISRDPIEEQGGMNLYAFVVNDPVNFIDVTGVEAMPTILPAPSIIPGIPGTMDDPSINSVIPKAGPAIPGTAAGTGIAAKQTDLATNEGIRVLNEENKKGKICESLRELTIKQIKNRVSRGGASLIRAQVPEITKILNNARDASKDGCIYYRYDRYSNKAAFGPGQGVTTKGDLSWSRALAFSCHHDVRCLFVYSLKVRKGEVGEHPDGPYVSGVPQYLLLSTIHEPNLTLMKTLNFGYGD